MIFFAAPILGATALAILVPFMIVFFERRHDDEEPEEFDR